MPFAQAEKFQKFRVRTYSTVTMIGGFILIIWMGHVPLMALIFTIQARMIPKLMIPTPHPGRSTSHGFLYTQCWTDGKTACFSLPCCQPVMIERFTF